MPHLVRSPRDEGVDSRSLSLRAAGEPPQPEHSSAVSTVFLAYPVLENQAAWLDAARDLRASLPQAMLLAVKLPLEEGVADEALVAGQVDLVVASFSEAVAFVLAGRTA